MSGATQCPVCDYTVAVEVSVCPQCGYDQVNRRYLSLTPEEEQALQAELKARRAQWQARLKSGQPLELPGAITITVTPIPPPPLPDYPPLPPLSPEVTQFEAQLAGVEQALQALQTRQHPALAAGVAVLEAAEAALSQAKSAYAQQQRAVGTQTAKSLTAALTKNPAAPWGELYALAPDLSGAALQAFVLAWHQNMQAQTQLSQLQQQWEQRFQTALANLQTTRQNLQEQLVAAQQRDLLRVVTPLLGHLPVAQWMPVWVQLEAGLLQRRYRFCSKPGELFLAATDIWAWHRADQAATQAAYQDYVQRFPKGLYIAQTQAKIAQRKAEEAERQRRQQAEAAERQQRQQALARDQQYLVQVLPWGLSLSALVGITLAIGLDSAIIPAVLGVVLGAGLSATIINASYLKDKVIVYGWAVGGCTVGATLLGGTDRYDFGSAISGAVAGMVIFMAIWVANWVNLEKYSIK